MKIRELLPHVSFSTLTLLVDRPDKFLRQKVFGKKELPTLTMMVGTALHKGAERVLEDASCDMAYEAKAQLEKSLAEVGGIEMVVEEDHAKKYESALKEIDKACKNFLSALPQIPVANVSTETKYESAESEYGIKSLGIVDVYCGDAIVDWKFVKTLSDEGERKPRYEQQAWFYRDLLAAQGIKIDRALFVEVKRAESKDGVNHRVVTVEFDESSPAYKLYRQFVREAKFALDADVESLLGRTAGTRSFLAADAKKAAEALAEEEKEYALWLERSGGKAADVAEGDDDYDCI